MMLIIVTWVVIVFPLHVEDVLQLVMIQHVMKLTMVVLSFVQVQQMMNVLTQIYVFGNILIPHVMLVFVQHSVKAMKLHVMDTIITNLAQVLRITVYQCTMRMDA